MTTDNVSSKRIISYENNIEFKESWIFLEDIQALSVAFYIF